jgi:ATP-dependent Lon protease
MAKSNKPPPSNNDNKLNKKNNKSSKKNEKDEKEEVKTPLTEPNTTQILNTSEKWKTFLENLEKKYAPVNPFDTDKDKMETETEKETKKETEKETETETKTKKETETETKKETETETETEKENITLEIDSDDSSELEFHHVFNDKENDEEEDEDYNPEDEGEEDEEEEDEEEEDEEEEEEDEEESLVSKFGSNTDAKELGQIMFSSILNKILTSDSINTNSRSPMVFLMSSKPSGINFETDDGNGKRKASASITNDLKRRKMDEIDREYKTFLNTKDKDDYEYFCELDLDQKIKILAEEKLVKDLSNDKLPLRMKVINSTLPPIIKGEIIRKLSSSKCGFGGNPKLMDWVQHIMRVPWSVFYPMPISLSDNTSKISSYLTNIYSRMDQAVCGHNETKCHIMQIIGKWITNPAAVGNCLALQGPMGVGKTTLVKEGLAPALGRPFNFISLGGATDASFLEGHSFTYEGSIPGQMVEVIQRSKCMNPIIYFDELDKISKSHRGEEIANLLIHITDTQQNDKFHDKYFGNIDIDLSKVFFVFSYNHDENVPPILRDRLQVVRVKGYNTTQKCQIAIDYMFPRFCKDNGFEADDLKITDDVINYVVSNYADKEDGVRNLGRCLETLVSRLNMIRLVQNCPTQETSDFLDKLPFNAKKLPIFTKNFLITRDIIDDVLIRPKVEVSHHHMYI